MTAAVAKQVVAAGNLANIDTPGYRTRDASFGDLLDGEVKKLGLSVTHPKQLPETAPADGSIHRGVHGCGRQFSIERHSARAIHGLRI